MRHLSLCLCVALMACGDDDKDKGPEATELMVSLGARALEDGGSATDVGIASRLTVEISQETAQDCRLGKDNSTVVVTADGTAVAGALVYFVDGLRVDFTPSGMWEYETDYIITATLECSTDYSATFSTGSAEATPPAVAVENAVRLVDLGISEPGAISNVLQGFLDDASLVIQILEVDDTTIRMLGGEGRESFDDPDIYVYRPGSFLFPMTGVYKPPFFQIEGRLSVPVEGIDTTLVLERFEISGRFVEVGGEIEVGGGSIRASSSCAVICEVEEDELQALCGNRTTWCDSEDNLNLIGTFGGAANDIAVTQGITIDPADGATDVALDQSFSITLSHDVNPSAGGAVIVQLRERGSDTEVAGSVTVDGFKAATFTPSANLNAGTTYDMLTVAHKAAESSFTTVSQ